MFFGATEASEKSFRLLRGYPLVAAAAAALRANWLLPVAVLAFAAAGILVLRHPLHARVGELDAAANAQAAGDTRYREADGPGEFFGDHGTVSDVTRRIRAEDRARHHEARFQSLFGDPAMLRQVWVNLIFNAFKFSAQVAAPRIAIGCRVADGEIDFSVVDNGAGFDPGYTEWRLLKHETPNNVKT